MLLVRVRMFDGPGVGRWTAAEPAGGEDVYTDLRPGDARRLAVGLLEHAEQAEQLTAQATLVAAMSGPAAELAHLFRALKAPAAARALPALADRAREEGWSYERFAEMLLCTEVNARDSHGGEGRIKTARFPARKTLEEFDFTFQRSVKKTVIEHLGQLDFLHGKENVILLGPPGTGKTHIATALGIRACLAGQRVLFATATQWVARLGDAKRQGQLEAELKRLSFVPSAGR